MRNVLYVTDRVGGEVHVVNGTGAVIQTFVPPSAPSQLIGIEIDSLGTAYVAGLDGRVHVFNNEGVFSRSIAVPDHNGFPASLRFVALSPDQTTLYVTEGNFGKGVHYFDLAGGDTYLGFYGTTQTNSVLLNQVTFASDGTLYVTDDGFGTGTGTIERYNPDGSFGGVFFTGVKAGWGLEVAPNGGVWLGNTNDLSGAPKILGFNSDGSPSAAFGNGAVLGQNAGMAFYDPPPGNTSVGSGISVVPSVTLPDGATGSVSLKFDHVENAGATTVVASPTGPPPPTGFKLTSPPIYFEITTTAIFAGNVRVCLSWTEGQIANENKVRMFHYENNQWVDITDPASRDTVNNKVCGTAASLSPFTLFEVKYAFTGFFSPVENAPNMNAVKAGAAVPVKFNLGGDLGLGIFAIGFPRTQLMQCDTLAPVDEITETVTAGASSLAYDPEAGQYIYVWKTDKAWGGSCRELQLKLTDGETYRARFTLRK